MAEPSDKKKNQHFVPQLLLRRFAVPGTRQLAIAVFDADKRTTIPQASIKHQCARSFFYGRDGRVENRLGKLETAAGAAIGATIRNEEPPAVGTQPWADLIKYFVVQHGRTPSAASAYTQQIKSMMNEARKFARSVGDEIAFEDIAQKMVPRHPELENLGVTAELGPVISDLEDLLLINETRFEFAVNDLGVLTHNQWATGLKGIGTNGLGCPGMILLMPLSSRHLLIKYDPGVYRIRGAARRVIRIREESQVKSLNYIQIMFAERNLYFSGDKHTREGLEKLAQGAIRAPRASIVKAQRLTDRTGTREVIHSYSERPKYLLSLDWLQVHRRMAAIPLHARAQQLRPAAKAALDFMEGGPEPSDPALQRTIFRRVK